MKLIFEHDDYKAFLLERIEARPHKGRGVRRRLAEAMGCQTAYVSHVLAAERHLSLEQGEAAARFFSLRDDETEFFLTLIERQRAGTKELRAYFDRKVSKLRADRREIQARIRVTSEISEADQATYYSSWHYQVIHTLLTIPDFRDSTRIAERLGLAVERVNEVLAFLLERGLAHEQDGQYLPAQKQIHLPRTSPLISKLHTNWRLRSLAALEHMKVDDYHYSGLLTFSHRDGERVRELLMKSLEGVIDIVRPSQEEKIALLAIDFFEI